MISGLNQEIELLGKTFHFQTELSDQGGLSIRTEVFVGGKVIATRENRIDAAAQAESDAVVRTWMKDQHQQTITTFVARARRYQMRGNTSEPASEAPEAPAPAPVQSEGVPETPPAAATTEKATPAADAPPASDSPELAAALRVRRFFASFRAAVDVGKDSLIETLPPDLKRRLAKTAQTLTWMIRSEMFTQIRIDEQARCHLLKEQIDEWLTGGCDPWRGAQIWSNVVDFGQYLAEVNLRSELVAHDQQLIIWALGAVASRGMTAEVRECIEPLYGRHPKLDQLLDKPEGVSDVTWTAHLRSVLTLL